MREEDSRWHRCPRVASGDQGCVVMWGAGNPIAASMWLAGANRKLPVLLSREVAASDSSNCESTLRMSWQFHLSKHFHIQNQRLKKNAPGLTPSAGHELSPSPALGSSSGEQLPREDLPHLPSGCLCCQGPESLQW